jgi:hypothetical protein
MIAKALGWLAHHRRVVLAIWFTALLGTLYFVRTEIEFLLASWCCLGAPIGIIFALACVRYRSLLQPVVQTTPAWWSSVLGAAVAASATALPVMVAANAIIPPQKIETFRGEIVRVHASSIRAGPWRYRLTLRAAGREIEWPVQRNTYEQAASGRIIELQARRGGLGYYYVWAFDNLPSAGNPSTAR